MKLGTQIQLSDGRIGTVVFNGLCGVGIKWGQHDPDPKDFENTHGDIFDSNPPLNWPWRYDAMLRDPWKGAAEEEPGVEFVGEDFEVIRAGYDF